MRKHVCRFSLSSRQVGLPRLTRGCQRCARQSAPSQSGIFTLGWRYA
ncbi:Uncharacterised protein [Vibrio cholerae]|nr:Uncharacterised protein [Vibrio cholerae]